MFGHGCSYQLEELQWLRYHTEHSNLEERTTRRALGHAPVLVEEAEGALLRLVALAGQVLEGLAAGRLLLAAHNATVLVLDEVRLDQATGGVLGSSVEDLGLGANGRDFGHLILRTRLLFWLDLIDFRSVSVWQKVDEGPEVSQGPYDEYNLCS